MANQYAAIDPNRTPALLGHSSTANTAETRRWVVSDEGSGAVSITGGTVVTTPSQGTVILNNPYSIRVDEVAAGTIYVGEAEAASAEGSAVWRIKRIVEASGTTTILFADGDTNFDNAWTGHGTISYS